MPESKPELSKMTAQFIAKLAMACQGGHNSFNYIILQGEDIIVFHREISGYTVTIRELDCLVANSLVEVSSYPTDPYPSGLADEDDDTPFTGYFCLTDQDMTVGYLLFQGMQIEATKLPVHPPSRMQVGPIQQIPTDPAKSADSATLLPTREELIASAAKFLIEGGEDEAASIILACTVEAIEAIEDTYWDGHLIYKVHVSVRGPRAAYDVLSDSSASVLDRVREAIKAVLPAHHWLGDLDIRAELMPIRPEWRAELTVLARGSAVNNQAATAEKFQLWEGLRFRSVTETRIAEALDRASVLFFPLCRARLTGPNGRINREPDFLVCKDGK